MYHVGFPLWKMWCGLSVRGSLIVSNLAIIEAGSRQFTVGVGDVVTLPRLEGAAGDSVSFDRVLLVRAGTETATGRPYLDGARVNGEIVEQGRDDKVVVFKFRRRTGYRRKNGHRQPHSVVRITAINA